MSQQAKHVVAPTPRKPSAIQPAKSKPVPLDRDALKQVAGGTGETPVKGW